MLKIRSKKPRGKCTPYAFFLNVCREQCIKKLSKEVDFEMLSKICWEKWNVMTDFQKIRFNQMSKYDELRYEKEMMEYKNRARKESVTFSEHEDQLLINALNDAPNGDWRNMDRKQRKLLSTKLQRHFDTIRARMDKLQRGSSKRENRHFSLEEDKIIIDSAIDSLADGSLLQVTSIENGGQIADSCGRHYSSIQHRWELNIRPWLLQYYAKTLNLEIGPMLASFLAENFESKGTIDWNFVLRNKDFSGHTVKSLKKKMYDVTNSLCHRQKVKTNDLSLKQIAAFAKDNYKPRKKGKGFETRQFELIEYFEMMVERRKIINFV